MNYKIICNHGHISHVSDVRRCPIKSCHSNVCWIVDLEEKFELSIKFDGQGSRMYIIFAKMVESGLHQIRTALNKESRKYSLKIKKYTHTTPKIKGEIWIKTPNFKFFPKELDVGSSIITSTTRKGYVDIEEYYQGNLVHITFESRYAVNAKSSRIFDKQFKRRIQNFDPAAKIIQYTRVKHREQPPYMGTCDPWFDAQVGGWD